MHQVHRLRRRPHALVTAVVFAAVVFAAVAATGAAGAAAPGPQTPRSVPAEAPGGPVRGDVAIGRAVAVERAAPGAPSSTVLLGR